MVTDLVGFTTDLIDLVGFTTDLIDLVGFTTDLIDLVGFTEFVLYSIILIIEFSIFASVSVII